MCEYIIVHPYYTFVVLLFVFFLFTVSYKDRITWSHLRWLGHNSAVKSSYIWLFVVPLAAKMLSPISGEHEFHIFGATLNVHFGLPFSWTIFYFMAIFFALGQIIYSLYCPKVLKDYVTYSDYNKTENGDILIFSWLEEFLGKGNILAEEKIKEQFGINLEEEAKRISNLMRKRYEPTGIVNKETNELTEYENKFYHILICRELSRTEKLSLIFSSNYSGTKITELFHFICKISENLHKKLLYISIAFFSAGFIFLGVIVIQNICYISKII